MSSRNGTTAPSSAGTAHASPIHLPIDAITRTLLYPQGNPVLADHLTARQLDFLCAGVAPAPDALRTLVVWRIFDGTRSIDPGFFTAVRDRQLYQRGVALLIACADHPDDDFESDPDALEQRYREHLELAWRLERHWLVEWYDQAEEEGRPPLLLSSYRGTVVLGSDLAPRYLPALAALSTFPLVTAAEVRAALGFLELPAWAPEEVSRALTESERAGLAIPAPPHLIEQYRALRPGIGPVYISLPYAAGRHQSRATYQPDPVAIRSTTPGDRWPTAPRACLLEADGAPNREARFELDCWRDYVAALSKRGLRTVWPKRLPLPADPWA